MLFAKLFEEVAVRPRHPPSVIAVRQFAVKHREQYKPAYVAVSKNDNSYLGIVKPSQLRKIGRESWKRAIANDISMKHVRD